ncbi:mitochondrial sodium/calcium exchanger protein-like [Bombus pascuorum]|uniref:mitochondrial sodium/calcium exchanger protein-like n=1 Tax=Bombus pascuorum TaxID=65598 RepID=UPI00298DDA1A|nr:mitochondrial sodium/calcium exchanger protein-like [Bombus pascuorum]
MDTYRYDDCSYVWNIPTEDRCRWVKETKDCFTDSVIQYTEILFCSFGSENTFLFTIGLVIMVIWLLYLFLILGTTADTFFHFLCLCSFCPSLAVIASVLQLSDNIAGVTILAFGNGAPDIFTSLVSGTDEGIIMFTELIGAGVFVTAIIAGSVAVVKPFRVLLKPLMRDACFYIVTICWISYVVRDGTVHLWEAISFVLCYLLFISLVVIMQIYENREERLKSRIPSVPDPDILRTYLANKDKDIIPRIPVKGRAVRLRTKMDIAIAVELGKEQRQNRTTLPEEILVEDVDRPKGLFKEFLYDINPIGEEDWTSANRFVKFILIIRSPVMLLLQLFIPLVNMTTVKRGWTKLLNCFQLCVTPTLSLFLLNVKNIFGQLSRLPSHFHPRSVVWKTHFGPVSVVPIFLVVGTVIGVIVFLMTHVDRVPKFHNAFAFFGFLAAMLTVYLVAGEVMAVLQCVGYAFSISDAMLGITFLAWGNSVGGECNNIIVK